MSDMCERWYALKFLVKSNKKLLDSYRELKNVYGNVYMKKSVLAFQILK